VPARQRVKPPSTRSFLRTILAAGFITGIIGVVGALLGGFLAAALFDAHPLDEFFDISTWLNAIIGSIILLAIYRVVVDRNRSGGRALRT
jgi:uncharacterized membrane protein YeaQ/YmgE (transglycosylase-associated protein family)